MIDLILVDDHQLFRASLKDLLQETQEFRVVAETGSGAQAREILRSQKADVLVLDISLKDTTGLEFLEYVSKAKLTVNILVLSMYDESQYGLHAMRLGAKSYLTKDASPEELKLALKKVAQGRRYISASFSEVLSSNMINESGASSWFELLTTKELEVMRFISKGQRLNAIAAKLNLSPKTVSTYRHRILQKLNLTNSAAIVRFCIEHNIE